MINLPDIVKKKSKHQKHFPTQFKTPIERFHLQFKNKSLKFVYDFNFTRR